MSEAMVPLSEETELQLAASFAPEALPELRSMLLSYGIERWEKESERVRFDILYLAAGDSGRVRKLVTLAKRDYRDILSGEYHRVDGRSTPHEWARRHPVNQKRV